MCGFGNVERQFGLISGIRWETNFNKIEKIKYSNKNVIAPNTEYII